MLSAWRHELTEKPVLSVDTTSSRFRNSSGYISYFVVAILRPYDVTTTSNLLFVHAISTEVRAWRHFLLLVDRVFCSFDFYLLLFTFIWLLFTLIQRDKVKWACVTLNEGWSRAANRGSNNLYRFLIKILYISLQWKDDFFGLPFYCFFWDCRSTKLLRLFSGNLPARFLIAVVSISTTTI